MDTLFFIIELIGVIAFAVSGAITAIRKELDIVGIIVVAVIAALGGGLIRDVILGIIPPNMFCNPSYYIYEIVAIAIGIISFIAAYFFNKYDFRMPDTRFVLNVADAVGLAVFCVFGVKLAVDSGFGEYKVLLVFVGVLTGVGGGATRDILVGEIPIIFRKYVYATPAILGTLFYVIFYSIMNELAAMLIAIAIIVGIRILAITFKWDLPKIKQKKKEIQVKDKDDSLMK